MGTFLSPVLTNKESVIKKENKRRIYLNIKIELYQLLSLEFCRKGCKSSEIRMVLLCVPSSGLFQTIEKAA